MATMMLTNLWVDDGELHFERRRDPNFQYDTGEWWCDEDDCDAIGSRKDFGAPSEVNVKKLLEERDCPVEDAVIDEALSKGWREPTMGELWEWMVDCISDPERDPCERIPGLLVRLCPTDADKWKEIINNGYYFMSAESFLEKLSRGE